MSKTRTVEEILAGWGELERPKNGTLYRHYKGGLYKVVDTGFLEDSEVPCVVYHSLEKDITWVRTAKNFLENVEYHGKVTPRFERV